MQAHARMYIRITNLTLFIIGSIGTCIIFLRNCEKGIDPIKIQNQTKIVPRQIIPWLFTKWRTFSATLNSPYSGYNYKNLCWLGDLDLELTKVASISQHHQTLQYRIQRPRKKSITKIAPMVIT